MTNISEIAKKLSERITNAETRQRSRTAEEYQRFLYAIEYILTDIWKASYIRPEAECSISNIRNIFVHHHVHHPSIRKQNMLTYQCVNTSY